MFKYSSRPGTFSDSYLNDDIPQIIKNERLSILTKLIIEIALSQNKKEIGKLHNILFTERNKKSQLIGITLSNKIAYFNDKSNNNNPIYNPGEEIKAIVSKVTAKSLIINPYHE